MLVCFESIRRAAYCEALCPCFSLSCFFAYIMSINCSACKGDLAPDSEIICDLCRQSSHATCVGVTRTEAQCLRNKNRKVTFYCPSCSDFKLQLQNLHNLTKTVDSLQKEVERLRERTGDERHARCVDACAAEDIIREVAERDARKNNLIIFNVHELDSGTKADQVTADVAIVGEIFDALNVSLPVPKPNRLGRFDPSKADRKRPIKITLPDVGDVTKALKNSRNLREVDKLRAFSLSKDRTPFQVGLYRRVREELLDRRAAGERDIRIRYVNDVPKIVKAENNLN